MDSSIMDREVYEFYRENRKKVAKGINDFNLFKKAVGGYFSLVKQVMEESEGGVYLNNIGYFCYVISTKKKKPTRSNITSIILRNTKRYIYFPFIFTDFGDFSFREAPQLYPAYKKKYKLYFDLIEINREISLTANRINYKKRQLGKDTKELDYI